MRQVSCVTWPKCVGFILEIGELNSLSVEVDLCMFSLPAVKGGSQHTI